MIKFKPSDEWFAPLPDPCQSYADDVDLPLEAIEWCIRCHRPHVKMSYLDAHHLAPYEAIEYCSTCRYKSYHEGDLVIFENYLGRDMSIFRLYMCSKCINSLNPFILWRRSQDLHPIQLIWGTFIHLFFGIPLKLIMGCFYFMRGLYRVINWDYLLWEKLFPFNKKYREKEMYGEWNLISTSDTVLELLNANWDQVRYVFIHEKGDHFPLGNKIFLKITGHAYPGVLGNPNHQFYCDLHRYNTTGEQAILDLSQLKIGELLTVHHLPFDFQDLPIEKSAYAEMQIGPVAHYTFYDAKFRPIKRFTKS